VIDLLEEVVILDNIIEEMLYFKPSIELIIFKGWTIFIEGVQ